MDTAMAQVLRLMRNGAFTISTIRRRSNSDRFWNSCSYRVLCFGFHESIPGCDAAIRNLGSRLVLEAM